MILVDVLADQIDRFNSEIDFGNCCLEHLNVFEEWAVNCFKCARILNVNCILETSEASFRIFYACNDTEFELSGIAEVGRIDCDISSIFIDQDLQPSLLLTFFDRNIVAA